MIGSFKFDGGIQNIVILFIILGVGAFLYLEIRKITIDLDRIKKRVDDISRKKEGFVSLEKNLPPNITPLKPSQISAKSPQGISLGSIQNSPIVSQQSIKSSNQSTEAKASETLRSLMEMPASDISDISDAPKSPDILDISDEKPPEIESSPTDLEVGPTHDYKDQEEDKDKVIVKDPDLSASDIKIITQDQDPYQSMTVSELKEILQEKGLPLSGNKTKLINRIKDNVNVEKK